MDELMKQAVKTYKENPDLNEIVVQSKEYYIRLTRKPTVDYHYHSQSMHWPLNLPGSGK